jgi:hypothetical protein
VNNQIIDVRTVFPYTKINPDGSHTLMLAINAEWAVKLSRGHYIGHDLDGKGRINGWVIPAKMLKISSTSLHLTEALQGLKINIWTKYDTIVYAEVFAPDYDRDAEGDRYLQPMYRNLYALERQEIRIKHKLTRRRYAENAKRKREAKKLHDQALKNTQTT